MSEIASLSEGYGKVLSHLSFWLLEPNLFWSFLKKVLCLLLISIALKDGGSKLLVHENCTQDESLQSDIIIAKFWVCCVTI